MLSLAVGIRQKDHSVPYRDSSKCGAKGMVAPRTAGGLEQSRYAKSKYRRYFE